MKKVHTYRVLLVIAAAAAALAGLRTSSTSGGPSNRGSGVVDPHEHKEGVWTRVGAVTQVFLLALSAGALIYTAVAVNNARRQNELASEQLERTSYQAVYVMQQDLAKLAVDKHELAPYLYGGRSIDDPKNKKSVDDPKEESSDPEEFRRELDAALSYMLDFDNFIYNQIDHQGLDDLVFDAPPEGYDDVDTWESWRTWSETIAGSFSGAPDLCRRLHETQAAYSSDFKNAIVGADLCQL